MTLPDLKEAHRLVERVESTRLVFRVFDDQSYQSYQPNTGFVAEPDSCDLTGCDAVAKSVKERLVFSNRQPTPWISTTRRWFWAVWEANRRYNKTMGHPNVRIAVIDLYACLTANEGISISSLGYNSLPFIHALSGLSSAEITYKRFADMSDEILVYHKIPPSAVISIWKFDRGVSTLPTEFIRSLPPSLHPDLIQAFRPNYELVSDYFLQDRLSDKWDAGQVGDICATVALELLRDACNRLSGEVGMVVKLVWGSSTRRPTRRSPRLVNRARDSRSDDGCDQSSTLHEGKLLPFSQAFVVSLAHKIIDQLVHLTDPFCRDMIEAISSRVVMQSSLIRVRHMRHRLDHFRSVALELARTVPLGPLDELHITQPEWEAMKERMFGIVVAKLAPLYKKLDVLLIDPIPRIELVDQVDPGRINTGAEWMDKEIDYPIWWEKCGVQKMMVDHRPEARFC